MTQGLFSKPSTTSPFANQTTPEGPPNATPVGIGTPQTDHRGMPDDLWAIDVRRHPADPQEFYVAFIRINTGDMLGFVRTAGCPTTDVVYEHMTVCIGIHGTPTRLCIQSPHLHDLAHRVEPEMHLAPTLLITDAMPVLRSRIDRVWDVSGLLGSRR